MRLRGQILVSVMGAALAAGAVGSWLLSRRTTEQGAQLLDTELRTGMTAVRRQWQFQRSERRRAYEAVIRNAYFRAYLLAGDRAQMAYFASVVRHEGGDLVAIVGGDDSVLATVGDDAPAFAARLASEPPQADGALVAIGGRVVDSFRIAAGDRANAGALLVGNYVDAARLREYGTPFGIDAAVRVGPALVSALPTALDAAVSPLLRTSAQREREIGPASDRYRILIEPFDRGTLLVGVGLARVRALTTDEARLVRALALLIVAVGGIGALFVIARLSNPIGRLSRAAEQLGAGQFAESTQLLRPLAERRDEIGSLAESFAAAVRNVQELLKARRELSQTRTALEAESGARVEADRRAQFFGMLAHELRTPLASIIGLNEIALADFGSMLPPNGRETLELAEQCAHRLLHVVNNMLDLGKLQAGRMEAASVPMDLRELVDECVAVTRVLTRDRPIDVRGTVDDAVARIESDPGKIRQILINLLGNAAKFVERGAIEVTAVRDGTTLRIVVRDEGPGIPEDAQRRIFEAFQQVDSSATRAHGGTGLGLTISLRLAEILGGTIRLASTVGVGSTFTLEIPLRVPSGSAMQIAS